MSRDTAAEVLVYVTGRAEACGRSFELCEGEGGPLDAQLATMRPDDARPRPERTPLW